MDHQHTLLQLSDSQTPSFMCSGCKELGGFGSSCICENINCNYIVHQECAEPVKHAVHPFFKNCNFVFYENTEKQCCGFCDACGKDLLGFFYICLKTGDTLHPCCLNLQNTISSEESGKVILKLCHEVPSDCVKCRQRQVVRNQFEGWSYVLESDGKSCFHVSCFKDFILEISNDDEKTTTRSRGRTRSFLKFTGKLAMNLVMDIALGDISSIGTIVEGVEALLSD
jgi:hypothetical protein